MAHARKTVREAFAALLTAAPASVYWKNVFETRLPPKRRVEPYLLVYVTSEDTEKLTFHAFAQIDRSAEIVVQGYLLVTDKQTAEDRIDAMAEEIEKRITLAALESIKVKGITSPKTEIELVGEDESAPTHAVLTMSWIVQYSTAEGVPQTLI